MVCGEDVRSFFDDDKDERLDHQDDRTCPALLWGRNSTKKIAA